MTSPRLLCSGLFASLFAGAAALAAPVSYDIDPGHTYPSFEADHMGISIWRGKFNKSSGKVLLDKEAGSGSVDVVVDIMSVDFGHEQLNTMSQGEALFNSAKFPQAHYSGKLTGFVNGAPTKVVGELSLHGKTNPMELTVNSFKCVPHPMLKRELCGADVSGMFQRDHYGISAGKDFGFKMDVVLRIQVEAIKAE